MILTYITYITCSSKEEAEKIAEILVNERLAACVSYFPITSVFEWEGKIQNEEEHALICKTTENKFLQLKKRAKEIHSYEVPAILAIKIQDGNEEFLAWVRKSLE